MTKLKLSLTNLVKSGLSLFLAICIISGCSSSTNPTYLKENIETDIQNICKQEYDTDVIVRLTGRTLWVYIPVEDIFINSDKPEKYTDRFSIEENDVRNRNGDITLSYLIRPINEQEKYQNVKASKDVIEKTSNVLKVLRRVIFSMERQDHEPRFFCIVTADIKNGFEIKELFYYLDLKKVSYGFISWGEYQHRTIQGSDIDLAIVGDTTGMHLDFRDISMEEFINTQIQHRIKLKFQRPEVERNADIDKEILKIVAYTLKTYGFKDFKEVELNNLWTENKIILNRKAVLSDSIY